MTSSNNAGAVDGNRTHFVQRDEPNFAWSHAVSTLLALPGLRGAWPMASVNDNSVSRAVDASGQETHLSTVGTPVFSAGTPLNHYVELDGKSSLRYAGDLDDWWNAVSCGIAAYDPLMATSFEGSKINMIDPGTYDATDGVAPPTWAAGTGWSFVTALSQSLSTGIIPPLFDGTWSMFVLYDNGGVGPNEHPLLSAGDYDAGRHFDVWSNSAAGLGGRWYGMGDMSNGPTSPKSPALWAGIAGFECYHNGGWEGTIPSLGIDDTATGYDIKIGLNPGKGWYFTGNIKRVWIGHCVLSSAEVAALYAAMIKTASPSSGPFVLAVADPSILSGRVLTSGDGTTVVDSGAGTIIKVNLTTPGTLAHNSTNSATGNHTHAITASDDPGAAVSLLKTNASGGINLGGNIILSCDGSTTADPRLYGHVNMSAGEAIRWGDANAGLQNGWGTRQAVYSYWGLELSGNRQGVAMPFNAGGAGDASVNVIGTTAAAPVLQVTGAAAQAGNHTEWRTSGGAVSASVDANFYAQFPRIGAGIAPLYPLHVSGVSYLDGQLIVNDAGADVDCRIEGDTDENLIYTDAGNNRVGIGIAAPLAKLHIAGTVDVIQQIVQGAAGQTANLTEWRNSAATPKLVVGAGGRLAQNLTGTAATNAAYAVYLFDDTTTETHQQILYAEQRVSTANPTAASYYGMQFLASVDNATANITGTLIGSLGGAGINGACAAVISLTKAQGGVFYLQNYSATATLAAGYGLYIESPRGAGTITSAIGLYIEAQTRGGSANYAIHTNAGLVLFGDKVVFTQTDGNEFIDSLADGYMDYGATTLHRFNNPLTIANIKSGATQVAAGAAANELWKTASHASLPNNVIMIGV